MLTISKFYTSFIPYQINSQQENQYSIVYSHPPPSSSEKQCLLPDTIKAAKPPVNNETLKTGYGFSYYKSIIIIELKLRL